MGNRASRVRAWVASWAGVALVASALTGGLSAQAAPEDPTRAKVEPAVLDAVAEDGRAAFWIRFAERPDLDALAELPDWNERGRAVHEALTAAAQGSQATARAGLDNAGATYRTFYATNAIKVAGGDADLVEAMAALPEVEGIYAEREYEKPEPQPAEPIFGPSAVEWGVQDINAPQVWDNYGVTGEDIVVASIDTGVQWDHPALVEQYRGNNGDGTVTHDYSWFDATGAGELEPWDWDGHGTHVTGTMVGDDGGDNQIGVAPGARWISAGVSFSDESLIGSGEWMLAPTDLNGDNPDPDLRPHVINNSWGTQFPSNDPFMVDISEAWAAAGQMGVWANGNSGPSCQSSGSPGSLVVNYSVGSYDINHDISSFSGRGPGENGEVKPNIAAPGDGVRSSFPGNNYGTISGTSMASPHVAGAVALLWSAGVNIVGDIDLTRALLDGSAIDTEDLQCGGTAENNNVFGEGRLDALGLLDAAPLGPVGTLTGTVTDADTGEPVAGATVSVVGTEMNRSVRTAADGSYTLRVSVGDYEVTFSRFGYVSQTANVSVGEDEVLTLDVALVQAPTGMVGGTVTDGSGQGWPLYARVAVGTEAATFTDPETGQYELELPEGLHIVRVTAQLPGYRVAEREVTVLVDAGSVEDFALLVDLDACVAPGYAAFYDGLTEDFNSEDVPDGWTVEDLNGGGPWTIGDPWGQPNRTGGDGLFAVVNSDFYGPEVTQDTVLVSPVVDLSGALTPVVEFKHDFVEIDAWAAVELTTDGGATWDVVWEQSSTAEGPLTVLVDLADAAGASEAQIRFHYVTFTWDWWWQVDDVFVGERSCDPTGGGLVTGYVQDDRDGGPVLNARVISVDNPSDVGITRATPADDNLDDGFYLMYSELEGVNPFEARASNFGSVFDDVDVEAGGVTRADWVLPSAEVEIEPTSIETTVELGEADSGSFTVTNTGSSTADLTFSEVRGGFDMLRANGTSIGTQQVRESAGAEVIAIPLDASPAATRPSTMAAAAEPAGPAPLDEPWEDLAMLPDTIMDNRMVTLDGAWYSIGGSHDWASATDAVWRYDPVELDWAPVAPLPQAVQQPAAAVLNGQIVVAGGWLDGGAVTTSTWIYDPGADDWTAGAELPVAVSSPGQAVVDGELYVVGGCTSADCEPFSATVQVYDAGGDSWALSEEYPESVAFPACGGLDGMLYCAGGITPSGDSSTTVRFDPSTGLWEWLEDAPQTVWASGHAMANRTLVVTGGVQGGDLSNATYGYSVDDEAWITLPASNVASFRSAATCGFVRAGGIDQNFEVSSRAEFLPGFDECEDAGADVPWLELDTLEASLEPGDSVTVEVTTDSAYVTQPGTYTAGVRVRGNLPTTPEPVDVTMTVTPPASWGKLDGTGSFMMCDELAIPIEGILVHAVPTRPDIGGGFLMTTDTSGYYARWVNDHIGELELSATLDGFYPENALVLPLRGTTVTTDFDLLSLQCEVDPGPNPPEVTRIYGANRYATAVSISQAFEPGADTVYVATGVNFPDALAAAARAGSGNAPVLLTRTDQLPDVTKQELFRLQPDRVVLVGGAAAIGEDVREKIESLLPDAEIVRYAGANRYATAALLSGDVDSSEVVYVATGTNFPDALAGSAVAASQDAPVLLVSAGSVPAATAAELSRLAPDRIVVLGGEAAVSAEVATALAAYGPVERVAGSNRYGTAAALAEAFPTARDVYVATGATFADALAGSALAGSTDSPVLLVRPDSVPALTWDQLVRTDPARIFVFGGPAAVSDGVLGQLAELR